MSHRLPTDADISKLHAEINIYLNQRITLLISAVSIVGVVLAWVTQKANGGDPTTLDVLYLGSSLLLGFLCVIYVLDVSLQTSMAACAVYLRLSNSSVWEADHLIYIDQNRNRSRRVQSKIIVYGVLGVFASGWPMALAVLVFQANSVSLVSATHVIITIAYLALVFGIAPRFLDRRYQEIEQQWKSVLSDMGTENTDA
jgi:hypothetical protein